VDSKALDAKQINDIHINTRDPYQPVKIESLVSPKTLSTSPKNDMKG
jgi:hypothetical protein